MNRKILALLSVQALIIVLMFWMLVFYGKDEYEHYSSADQEEVKSINRVNQANGQTLIEVPLKTQQQNGIVSRALEISTLSESSTAYGTVVNLDDLMSQRARYLTARADAQLARASLGNSQQAYLRMKALNADNKNVSDQALAASEALYKSDMAKIHAADILAEATRDSIRQQWGAALTEIFTQSNQQAIANTFLNYQNVLVQITLPAESAEPITGSSIQLKVIGADTTSIKADYISASPRTDTTIQGKTYFYRAPAKQLRAGMRLLATLPETSNHAASGYIVPHSAVVWFSGKPWVYQQKEDDQFVRIAVDTTHPIADGWLNFSPALAGKIAVAGAQLLLSEEFRFQIKNENDD